MIVRVSNRGIAAALVAAAFGFAAEADEARDRRLVDSGFVLRSANTPELMARAKRHLKPNHFVSRTSADGTYYLYFDPDYCKCVFAGDERAMRTYRDMTSPGPLAPTIALTDPRGSTAAQVIEQQAQQDADDFHPNGLLGFRF